MSDFQQNNYVILKAKHRAEERGQALEPDSDMAEILESSHWEF